MRVSGSDRVDITLENRVIGRIEPHKGRIKSDIRLAEPRFWDEVGAPIGEDRLEFIEPGKYGADLVLVDLLGTGEACAIDAVVDLGVDP